MLKKEEILLIIYFILVILLLVAFVVVFFYVFQMRKNKLLFEKWETQRRYEQEIVNSRLEIQEQTLKNVGWELHDNIGQLLSVARMQLNMLGNAVEASTKEQVKEIGEIVGSSLKEVRSLSKSLNNEVVGYLGLESSLSNELERFERLKMLKVQFETSGETREIPQKDAIVLFRILQEFFSNVIKHAKAKNLKVKLKYGEKLLIEARDDGKGFDPETVSRSSGLINMKSRAELIGAEFHLQSRPGEGTSLKIVYPNVIK